MITQWPTSTDIEYAVIGDPIAHSLSPQMQNAAFAALGLGEPYCKYHVTAQQLAEFVDFAKAHLKGFNITVPHKKAIIPFLDEISGTARLAQSVNTVSIKDGKLYGDSTDGFGLATAIHEAFNLTITDQSFLFIGCGGAVQAVAVHLAAIGVQQLYFVNRTLAKAERLAEIITSNYPCQVKCCTPGASKHLKEFIDASSVLIQGTSLGLKADDPPPFDFSLLDGTNIAIYDTIYHATALLRYADQHHFPYADGSTMLLHQGAQSFAIWTGRKAPIEVMRRALQAAKS